MHTNPTTARRPLSEKTMLIVVAIFAALEGYDLACYGVTVPSMLADRSMGGDAATAGTVGSLVAVGMMIGAALAGAAISRLGPRRLLLTGAGAFSAGMLACAVAPGFAVFGAARLLVGVGLGVVLPTLTAYVADLSDPGRRSRNVGLMMSGYAFGALLAPLLGAALLPHASWHWIYVIGAAPALVLLPIAARILPESPVHADRGARPAARNDLFGLKPLLAPGTRTVTLLFWIASFCGLLLVFGISTWLPTIMRNSGYSLGSALLQTAAMWVGAGLGMIAGGRIADGIGIKPVVSTAFLVGSISLIAMSARPAIVLLFLLMFVSGLGFIGSQVMTNAFIVNRYPEAVRGAGIGWALSVGRLGAILGPSMGGWILSSQLGVEWNFYLFAIPGLIGATAAALVPVARAARHAVPEGAG
ncbi:AAHS family benzoate transporter-like MFS transporter [Nonomuraea polychroma]|uniref:AAHS family benzoate transporter-like MFS transporter n=1 Tax=Nonomuraea polychroma TaxID=46176 RepID=A0A438LY81_9ACTN|nr:MFS transporter [Nonomuraea polychroma]RVX38514.1 AAHS family benzoate transporter-like MFS transporter [Nonomuraea polychroma]